MAYHVAIPHTSHPSITPYRLHLSVHHASLSFAWMRFSLLPNVATEVFNPFRISISSRKRILRSVVAAAGADDKMESSAENQSAQLYGKIERVFTEMAQRTQGGMGDAGRWQEMQGAWVLRPSQNVPFAVVHFIGGVFVGAAPQLTYRLFLERLAERGFLVVATPFASGFDHLRISDEVQFKFDRCIRSMQDDYIDKLPIFGVGHSLGALMQLLIGARFAVQRVGNVLISFNNKEASSAIPLFSPIIVPMAQNFGPIFTQIMASPGVRYGAELAIRNLQNLSPALLKQVLPLVEQLPPLYMDLANGRENFTPHPDETLRLVKLYYGIGRNMLVKFKDDQIDETPVLAQALSSQSLVSSFLDMSVRTLPGDHARPLQQLLPEVPPVMADAVSRGSELLENLAAGTPWATMAKDVRKSFGVDITTQHPQQQIIEDIERLVDEIASWMMASLK